jgi:hypothetical protein
MEKFIQGQRLKNNDLVLYFYERNYYNIINLCIPYWIRYSVGYIHPPTGKFLLIGIKNRIPQIIAGKVQPNFIIGKKWKPGIYEVFWRYKEYEDSLIKAVHIQFEVLSDGVTQSDLVMGNHFDLPANLIIY